MKRTEAQIGASREDQINGGLDADFEQSVRDALRHLHDQVYLRTHPLTRLAAEPHISPSARGKKLHELLVEAIASTEAACTSNNARAARRHALLTLRYVEGLEIEDVAARIGISRREYTRLHREALDAVVSALEDSMAPHPPPPATLPPSAHASPRNRLPVPLSSFVGREQEMADVHRLIESVRLVTLTGPPGTGKTRLALQVAADLSASSGRDEEFPDGVHFVPLAPIGDPGLVLSAIAQTLSLRGASGHSLINSLEDRLSQHRGLLILDNFEHVISAAQAVSQLLISCPHLKVLVTSREALRLSGEYEFAVPPLQVPGGRGPVVLEDIADCEAVRLYIERAAGMKSGFRLTAQNAPAVAELCRRLDGLPLAIELAAARSRIFPPYALLARLRGAGDSDSQRTFLTVLGGGARDVPDRHRTLRDAIDWSYRLLTPDEQRLFGQLAVFAGGWTLEAAEAVCSLQGELEILEGMVSLIDKSLVQQGETSDGEARFSMLETIREYARDRLVALGEEARTLRHRHALHFLAFAREADAHYWGREQSLWLGRLNRELDNLRTALSWSRDSGEAHVALRLAGALRNFWFDSGLRMEGRAWLESALGMDSPTRRTADHAAALLAAGECNWLLNDFGAARSQFEESLSIWEELGDQRGKGQALHGLAVIMTELGDLAMARRLCEEALLLSSAAGDRPSVALELHGLGLLAVREGDAQTARSRVDESRQIWQELGDTEHLCLVSNVLGDLARLRGEYSEAAGYYRECLELIGEQGPQGWRALYLHNLGHATYPLDDEPLARALFTEALARYEKLGDRRGVAECVGGLACLAAETEPERTTRLLGAVAAVIEALGSRPNPSNQAQYDHSLARARSRLGDEVFEAAWRQGRSWTLEQVLTEALSALPSEACTHPG